MNFKLFGKTILVVIIKFELFWAIHSASELSSGLRASAPSRSEERLLRAVPGPMARAQAVGAGDLRGAA